MSRANDSEHDLVPLRQGPAPSDPYLRHGARLLSHATPMPRSEARKRRVWNLLSARSGSRIGLRFSAVHVAFASVLFAAVSSAAAGRYYVEHKAEARRAEQAQASLPAAGKPQHHRAARRAPGTIAGPPAAPVAEVPLKPETVVEPEAVLAPRLPTRAKVDSSIRSKANDADAELLVEAMRARSAGDAKRVSQLVAEYRAKHPQGVLQEEALILSIESAVARRAPNAGALAHEYLGRFPNGRFATQARRALAVEAP
jgi:hypothetical protein